VPLGTKEGDIIPWQKMAFVGTPPILSSRPWTHLSRPLLSQQCSSSLVSLCQMVVVVQKRRSGVSGGAACPPFETMERKSRELIWRWWKFFACTGPVFHENNMYGE
jgi:hypothetical protein